MMSKTSCQFDGCKTRAIRRGLCEKHYFALWRAVKAKRVTWTELEEAGACLPPNQHRVGRPGDPKVAALLKKIEQRRDAKKAAPRKPVTTKSET